jgi:tetratricopeptide (TPR) repeat protein
MTARHLIGVVLVCCAVSAAASEPAGTTADTTPKPSRAKRDLVAIKAALMAADYGADLATLASLRTRVAQLSGDPDLGYLADYWSGFASWRIAINGANAKMASEELKTNLERAVADFESSIHKKNDFADAYAAASGTYGWLGVFNRNDAAAMKSNIDSARQLLKKALELEPSNPRALWVRGGVFLFVPQAQGGSADRAIEIYRKIVDDDDPIRPDSPLPDWGKAEALMSLAYAHANSTSIDLNAAAEEAHAALRLQPEWHYVRDILAPDIEARRKQAGPPKQ